MSAVRLAAVRHRLRLLPRVFRTLPRKRTAKPAGQPIPTEFADLPRLLTIDMTAELLHVSRRAVQRWLAGGRLKATRTVPGGRVLILRSEVLRLLGL